MAIGAESSSEGAQQQRSSGKGETGDAGTGNANNFRKDGIPCRSSLEFEGKAWAVEAHAATGERWRELLAVRLKHLRLQGKSEEDELDLTGQKAAEKDLEDIWLQTPWGLHKSSLVNAHQDWTQDRKKRTMRSFWKCAQFLLYGGHVFVRLALAVGSLNEEMMACVRMVHQQVREADVKRRRLAPEQVTANPGAGKAKKGFVDHKTSPSKRAREDAKRLDRQIAEEIERWRWYQGTMSWAAFRRLNEQAEELQLSLALVQAVALSVSWPLLINILSRSAAIWPLFAVPQQDLADL